MLLFAAVLLLFSLGYCLYFLQAARELKRMESNTKSPIFELFGSVLQGIGTIRGFNKVQEYVDRMYGKVTHTMGARRGESDADCIPTQLDRFSEITYQIWLSNRWMAIRLNFVGTVFGVAIAGLVVAIPNIDAALAGFALSFVIEFSYTIIWAVRRYTDLELDMNCAERIIE